MSPCLRQNVSLGYIISAAFFFIAAVLVPETVLADSLKLYVEEDYTSGSLKSTDQSGAVTKTRISTFDQLYNLYMDKTIFPNLLFDAGGLFGRDNSVIKTDSSELHSADNKYFMFADLRLNTKPFFSAIGYTRRADTSTALGTSFTNVDERYNGIFSWKPEEGLPSLDLNYTKDFSYDATRTLTNNTSDQLLLGLKYDPVRSVGLTYNLNYIDSFNFLNDIDSTVTTHIGKITYDDSYFNKRVHITSAYDITDQTFVTTAGAGVSVEQVQLFPVHGLSGISDLNNPAQTPLMITLNENPALIDGNLTASAGINLGLNSGLVTVPAPPRQEWNIGDDFVTPTQLNALFIWVDKDLTRISDLFNWDIYVSDDNITWTKEFTVTVAPSGFSTLPLPHFIINFPSDITSRFVKAVVKPLDSVDQTTIIIRGLNPNDFKDIAVTELQPFRFQVSSNRGKTSESAISQHFDLNGRAKILESRNLFYDLALFLARNDPGALTTAFLSNGLSFSQKFGGIFTLNARAARDDNYLLSGHGVEYQYSASLSATPYATLNDSLIYSGRYNTNTAGKTSTQNSIFLYNTAMLYTGVNTLLNGGVTFGTLESGQSSQTIQGNFGLTLVPNPKMNLNLTYSIINTSLSGGNLPANSSTTYAGLASATYTPVNAIYLFASIQLNRANNILQTATNYGVNFSPFPDGALQFHFVYNETLGSGNIGKSRLISPSLRWNIRSGAYLDLAYSIQQSSIAAQINDSRILSSSLKIAL